jgi:hypothetical protein
MACKDVAWKASWRARVAAAILDISEPDWRMTLSYRLPLPELHSAAEAKVRKHRTQVVKRTVKAQLVEAAKKRSALLECRRKVSEQEKRVNPQSKFIQKDRTVTMDDVLTHRKLDEVIRDSFRLGLEEAESTDERDLDFSPDDAGESDCSDGVSLMQDHFSSESSSDDGLSGMGLADLENSVTHLWDATQEITEAAAAMFILPDQVEFDTVDLLLVEGLPTRETRPADARCAYSSPRRLDTPPCVIRWTFGEIITQ